MKRFIGALALLFLCSLTKTLAQCDNAYYNLKEGVEFELTTYDKKDKVASRVVNKITSLEQTDEGQVAHVHMNLFDKKDKQTYEGEYSILCQDGMVKLDMKSMFESMMASMQQSADSPEIDMTVEGYFIAIPSDLSVGDQLPDTDGTIEMKLGNSDMAMNTTEMHMSNRKVLAEEELTTPAGTFTCMKISQDTEVEMKIMMMKRKDKSSGEVWLAKGVGMVRTNDYDDKGKLRTYTVLTNYKE